MYLEDYGDNVVADVALPLQLLRVADGVRQEGGDVEHDLLLAEPRVHRLRAGLAVMNVETASVAGEILKGEGE